MFSLDEVKEENSFKDIKCLIKWKSRNSVGCPWLKLGNANQEEIYLHLLCIHLERIHLFSFPAGGHLSLFIHIRCEGCLRPHSSGYILYWLFPCSSSLPSPPFFLFSDTRAAACMALSSDSLAGGARFLSRIWSESERQAAGRRVFFFLFF